VAGVGAGSGWAVGLPFGAVGAVGLGILGVAALASAPVRGGVEESEPPALRSATAQATLVYTKLVELSMTADLVGVPTDVAGGTAAVSASLDAVRAVFAELEVAVGAGGAL
jgi:hypothetical protein